MKNKAQGFTLIELLVVMAIIGVLAAVLLPNFSEARKRPNDVRALQCGRAIVQSSIVYRASNGRWPDSSTLTAADLGEDTREACEGVRVMAYAVPTSATGTENTKLDYNAQGPTFMVAKNGGTGLYAYNLADNNTRLKLVKWSAYNL